MRQIGTLLTNLIAVPRSRLDKSLWICYSKCERLLSLFEFLTTLVKHTLILLFSCNEGHALPSKAEFNRLLKTGIALFLANHWLQKSSRHLNELMARFKFYLNPILNLPFFLIFVWKAVGNIFIFIIAHEQWVMSSLQVTTWLFPFSKLTACRLLRHLKTIFFFFCTKTLSTVVNNSKDDIYKWNTMNSFATKSNDLPRRELIILYPPHYYIHIVYI